MDDEERLKEPKVEMVFQSKEEVFTFYTNYAKLKGFGVVTRSSKRGDDGNFKYFTFACAKSYKKESTSKNLLASKLSTKTGCQAKIRFKRCDDGSFKITTVELIHDHDLSPGKARHLRCHRKLNDQVKRRLDINDQAGIAPNKNYHSLVVDHGGYENVTFNEMNCRNYIDELRRKRLGVGDAEAVCKYFAKMQQSDPNFFYVMDVGEDSRLRNLFWADGRSKAAYESFADVITFDTTYLTNKYDMPFAPFVGVNHHGQSVLFGCGLLSTEDTNSFVWLFQSWLNCMSGRLPKAIITDQCKAMQNAIEIVFPNTKHRWCLWHIMKKLPEKLRRYSKYEEIKEALQCIVYDSLNENEFENGWSLMIDTYDLNENDWLESLYKERHRWVPTYVKHTFWAGMSTTQRSESMNAFFDGYVNSKTTLKVFVEKYEKALESKVEKEKAADFHSFNSRYECLSNYEIEKQFQRLYTNEKFREFQDELKGKFYCYHSLIKDENPNFLYGVVEDVKVGDKRRDVKFMVDFNEVDCEVKCNCRLFEFRGILCRHALLVLILRKVSEIPSRYILSRWRKDLKRGYTCIRSSYNLSCKETQRCEQMCDAFREVAILVASEDDKYKRVMDGIKELKSLIMNDEVMNSHTTQGSCLPQDNEVDKQNMSSGANKVLSPLVIRRKGRPPSKRRVSKLEQVVKSLKMKKKRKQVEEKNPKQSRQRQSSISYDDIDSAHIPSSPYQVDEMGMQESFVTTNPMMSMQGFYMVPQPSVIPTSLDGGHYIPYGSTSSNQLNSDIQLQAQVHFNQVWRGAYGMGNIKPNQNMSQPNQFIGSNVHPPM